MAAFLRPWGGRGAAGACFPGRAEGTAGQHPVAVAGPLEGATTTPWGRSRAPTPPMLGRWRCLR
jgi:hypothetical protein